MLDPPQVYQVLVESYVPPGSPTWRHPDDRPPEHWACRMDAILLLPEDIDRPVWVTSDYVIRFLRWARVDITLTDSPFRRDAHVVRLNAVRWDPARQMVRVQLGRWWMWLNPEVELLVGSEMEGYKSFERGGVRRSPPVDYVPARPGW